MSAEESSLEAWELSFDLQVRPNRRSTGTVKVMEMMKDRARS